MNMEEARLYCLKLERDRERSWRESRQGAFEASMLSLDEHVGKFDDPSKIAIFSDGDKGAESILRGAETQAVIVEEALARLSERDRAFAKAVLAGTTWREMGITRQGFNWRMRKIERELTIA